VRNFQQRWSGTPYPPVFVTVHAVVVRSGHILIIKRQRSPGKGLMALPGGFIEPEEYLLDACLRKLRQETGLCLDETVLKASIEKKKRCLIVRQDLSVVEHCHMFSFFLCLMKLVRRMWMWKRLRWMLFGCHLPISIRLKCLKIIILSFKR